MTITKLLNFHLVPKAHAATGNFSVNIGDETKSRVAINTDLGSFVSKSFSAVLLVAGLATFMYLVYGGIQWISSGGDKGKLEEARSKITNGIIGLAIVASAWAVYCPRSSRFINWQTRKCCHYQYWHAHSRSSPRSYRRLCSSSLYVPHLGRYPVDYFWWRQRQDSRST